MACRITTLLFAIGSIGNVRFGYSNDYIDTLNVSFRR